MWHIMWCGLLALFTSIEFGLLENLENPLLTGSSCESCATCAKCAKNNVRDRSNGEAPVRELREVREMRDGGAQRQCATETRFRSATHRTPRWSGIRGLRAIHGPCRDLCH